MLIASPRSCMSCAPPRVRQCSQHRFVCEPPRGWRPASARLRVGDEPLADAGLAQAERASPPGAILTSIKLPRFPGDDGSVGGARWKRCALRLNRAQGSVSQGTRARFFRGHDACAEHVPGAHLNVATTSSPVNLAPTRYVSARTRTSRTHRERHTRDHQHDRARQHMGRVQRPVL